VPEFSDREGFQGVTLTEQEGRMHLRDLPVRSFFYFGLAGRELYFKATAESSVMITDMTGEYEEGLIIPNFLFHDVVPADILDDEWRDQILSTIREARDRNK
jgi:hypothetical protein